MLVAHHSAREIAWRTREQVLAACGVVQVAGICRLLIPGTIDGHYGGTSTVLVAPVVADCSRTMMMGRIPVKYVCFGGGISGVWCLFGGIVSWVRKREFEVVDLFP